jgi:hypothetical protein
VAGDTGAAVAGDTGAAVAGDTGVALIAARQHGPITRPQLARLGIDDNGIARRRRKGTLHRVHQGVYAVGHPSLTTRGRWAAAVLACGPAAALSHIDARPCGRSTTRRGRGCTCLPSGTAA